MDTQELITIGVIVAPHGVRGDVRILPRTDFPERFMNMDVCYINGEPYHITSAKFHKQFILATFKELPDRTAVERLGKQEIKVPRQDLMELPEDRYYIFEIEGLAVEDTEGNDLGIVKEVLQPGANDVYVVAKEGEPDLLLPALKTVVLTIDIESGKMIVDPPEWL